MREIIFTDASCQEKKLKPKTELTRKFLMLTDVTGPNNSVWDERKTSFWMPKYRLSLAS